MRNGVTVLEYELANLFTHPSVVPTLGVGPVQSNDSASESSSMLLTSTGVISRSQHQHQEESVLLLRKIEELNKNTARLIAEAVKLIQESKQLSARVKSLETPSTKLKSGPSNALLGHYLRPPSP